MKNSKQIKCYCGHTTYCDCIPLEVKIDILDFNQIVKEPKQETLEEAAENSFLANKLENSTAVEKAHYIAGFRECAKWQQKRSYSEKQMDDAYDKGFKDASERMYSEEEVKYLLEVQRGNCYVALLSHTNNDDIASVASRAPEPGGKNGTWVK